MLSRYADGARLSSGRGRGGLDTARSGRRASVHLHSWIARHAERVVMDVAQPRHGAGAALRRFHQLALAVTLALLISYLVYALAQSYVIRPSPTGRDWLSAAVRHVYALDQPYNDFPSLHTSLSAIVAILWWRVHRRTGVAVAIWCGLIVASTVLIHQHYLADIAGGLAVAWRPVAAGGRIVGAIHRGHPGTPDGEGRTRLGPMAR